MEEDYKQKIDKNLEYSQEILCKLEKIHHQILLRNIITYIKIVIIVIPIILAIIYLPPYLEDFYNNYIEFLKSFKI